MNTLALKNALIRAVRTFVQAFVGIILATWGVVLLSRSLMSPCSTKQRQQGSSPCLRSS